MMNYIKVLSFILFSILVSKDALSQSRLDDKSQKKYDKIKDLIKENKTEKAIEELEKFIEDNPEYLKAHLSLGNLYLDKKEWEKSFDSYNNVLDLKPDYSDERIFYTMAFAKRQLNDYDAAINYMDEVLSRLNAESPIYSKMLNEKKQIEFVKDAFKNPIDLEVKPLPEIVNSEHSEYLPSYIMDGSKMIFTRRIGQNEDLFLCTLENDSIINVESMEVLNTPANEGGQAISPDGQWLIFTSCEREDSKGGCDLYLSRKREGQWTSPVNLGDKFNTRYWESQPSLSVDGSKVFFSSERPGGSGNKDIWVVKIDPKSGKFGRAENLGAKINTRGNESSPFIHPDGKTLYFRSDFHPGMGDFDLYVSRKQADNTWSTPKNLGYPINTELSEGALFVSLDGKKAYYSSDAESDPPNLNIYSFDMPEEHRPIPTTFLKATVIDDESKLPLKSILEIVDLKTNEKLSHITDIDGIALTALPANSRYAINIQTKGYLFYSKHIDLDTVKSIDDPYIITAELSKLKISKEEITSVEKESKPIVLENVFFATGSSELLPGSEMEINKLDRILKRNSGIKIKIVGHTDNVGSEEDNLKLSEDRAKAVYMALKKRLVAEGRMIYEGKGETMPRDTNETKEGRQNNRRTEFIIVYK